MELLQLKYFLMLARTEHVSKTAAALHISQPSLSSTIKKLENELGVPLFHQAGPQYQKYLLTARLIFPTWNRFLLLWKTASGRFLH